MAVAFLVNATPARAVPVFRVDLHHYPSNFAPGGSGDYQVEIANLGDSASAGPLSLRLALPNGLGRYSIQQSGPPTWSCPGSPGAKTTICTTSDSISRHSVVRNLILSADVAPTASGERFASARLEGGGAAERATTNELTPLSAEPAPFGVLPNSFLVDSFAADGTTPIRESGAHPAQMIIGLDLGTLATPPASPTQIAAAGSIRHFQLALPPGFLGNPTAPGECTPAELTVGACPRSAQVGRIELATGPFAPADFPKTYSQPVFNMQSPHGVLADLALAISGNPVHIKLSLDPADHYAILASASDVNETESLLDLRMTLWGVPADHSHDSERCGAPGDTSAECATDLEPKPFLTVPSQCGVDQQITLRNVDSWQHSSEFLPAIAYQLPGQGTECDRPRFEPGLSATPTTMQADSPTGLNLHLSVPQNDNPNALATPPIKDFHLTLPAGMRISPAAADGLDSCTPAEINLATNDAVTCPDASRLGEATITTPLLPEPLQGFLYLATPHDNPTDSLFALYLVVQDSEDRGVLLKLPGHLDLDPTNGRISASFNELPQLPFEDLNLSFRSGSRAPLLSGPACGTQTITASVSSWAQPAEPLQLADSYAIDEGPSGAPCAAAAKRPFAPQLSAGTINPTAAARTPFVFKLSRSEADQPLSQIAATLPPGLSAEIAGIPTCPDSAIATIPSGQGSARLQLTTPSCAIASRLGAATIATGAGPDPLYLTGSIYLAGPFRGAPFSLIVIVPALAGPFDLGTLATRIAVSIDPSTAQLTLSSDPLPAILAGVPIEVRQISLLLDRPGFILNPTSCEPFALTAQIIGNEGATSSSSSHFQVGNCASLPFRPRLALQLSGALARNGHPALKAVLTAKPGQADIARAALALPRTELLEYAGIRAVCGRTLYASGGGGGERCPPASRYGHVKVFTPLLDRPLEGPVYLRSNGGERRLPDLVASLSGQAHLDLVAHLSPVHGLVRAVFVGVPDLPLSRLALQLRGGGRGLLVNTKGLCRARPRARAAFLAHNDKRSAAATAVKIKCGQPKAAHRRRSR